MRQHCRQHIALCLSSFIITYRANALTAGERR